MTSTPRNDSEAGPSPQIDDKKWRHLDETVVESFFDRARQNLHCRIACGGLTCKHEDYSLYLNRTPKPAIHGLNSNWVGDNVVASQRPSTSLFAKFDLIKQFHEKRITGVFNLQEKGEHAYCGPNGIFSDSGYSYNGERDLMRFGISYYEFPWPDMMAPENDIVFRSVQCMDSHIKKLGSVLVHCHAGLGRTGLMIACYFILCQHKSARESIELVRKCRPGAVQTSRQVAFVEGFEKFSRALGFTMKRTPKDPFLDFSSYMKRQYEFLHGDDSRTYRYVPYHIHQILCRVIDLASTGGRNAATEALASFSLSNEPSAAVVDACRAEINQRRYNPEKTSNIALLVFLVLDWFRSMDSPFFAREHAALFLRGLKDPRRFIRSIAATQVKQQQQEKNQQQQQQSNTTATTSKTVKAPMPMINNLTGTFSSQAPSGLISPTAPPISKTHTQRHQEEDSDFSDSEPPTSTQENNNNKNLTINVVSPLSHTHVAVVPASSPFFFSNNTSNTNTAMNSISSPSGLPSVGNGNENGGGGALATFDQTVGSVMSQTSFNQTFHKKPRIPWILQKEVEEGLPREVRYTAALVLSAIATLTAEAAPVPSLLDLAIQSTVDAFTLNLPPDAFHTFYYKDADDTSSNNNYDYIDNKSAPSTPQKKKLYTLTTTDRRLLYEAFTRWCAHEHSTYFDVFSANPSSPLFASMNSASVNQINMSTRQDRQEQRIISGLQSAAEGRLQNYSNKINNAVSNMTSRSVTPQLSPTFSSHHHHHHQNNNNNLAHLRNQTPTTTTTPSGDANSNIPVITKLPGSTASDDEIERNYNNTDKNNNNQNNNNNSMTPRTATSDNDDDQSSMSRTPPRRLNVNDVTMTPIANDDVLHQQQQQQQQPNSRHSVMSPMEQNAVGGAVVENIE